ncbi:hypothetical protein MA20_46695 [Bradyrhizobium japonicum]|uniref:Uncharacterized protein n=1 Tax=Bradyrhizobium japonicum TaxID=375 RepID=A0A0A3YHA1_BRAJP|nr:hypothetical protein MA20_46695 [Bradyrhizobium japonicum]
MGATLSCYSEPRQARAVLSDLVNSKLLVSDTPKGNVRLGFPSEVPLSEILPADSSSAGLIMVPFHRGEAAVD